MKPALRLSPTQRAYLLGLRKGLAVAKRERNELRAEFEAMKDQVDAVLRGLRSEVAMGLEIWRALRRLRQFAESAPRPSFQCERHQVLSPRLRERLAFARGEAAQKRAGVGVGRRAAVAGEGNARRGIIVKGEVGGHLIAVPSRPQR
jgi:hypothetical protein